MGLKQKVPPKKAATKKSNAKKSFAEAAVDAAKAAVETVTVRTEAKAPRRRVSFEGVDQTKKTSAGKSNKTSTAAAAAAKRAAVSGIIEAKKRRRDEEEEENDVEDSDDLHDNNNNNNNNSDDENSSSNADDDNESQNSEDDLSDVADAESEASDEAAWEETNPFEKSQRDGTRLAYPALRLRFLPPEFQEPQLYKFLGQFGARVLNCFCVRSRRTHQSKGIAYVQFDTDAVLPIVVEECHGMSLAGRALQAHRVILHRAMPTKEKTTRRRRLAYVYNTRGRPLQRHDVRRKSPIAALVKYARKETENNAHLKRLGIDYESHSFAEQLASVPKHLIINKKQKKSKQQLDKKKKKSKKDNKKSNKKRVGRGGSSNGNGNGNGVDRKKNGVESTVVSSSLPTAGEAKQQKVENKSSNGGTLNKKTVPVTTTTKTAANTTASPVVSKKKTTTPPPTQKRRTGVKKG